jgi:hypothetical protein
LNEFVFDQSLRNQLSLCEASCVESCVEVALRCDKV